MNPENIPAFPATEATGPGGPNYGHPGMSLRDYFAAKALQAGMAGAVLPGVADEQMPEEVAELLRQLAVTSYRFADAMLKARG